MAKSTLTLLTVCIAVLCFGITTSCTRRIYVPVERTVTDTVKMMRFRSDSIMMRDSIFLDARGDTVIKEVYRWKWRTKTRVDTVYKTRIDTVRIPTEIITDKKKKASGNSINRRVNRFLIALVVLILGLFCIRNIFKR